MIHCSIPFFSIIHISAIQISLNHHSSHILNFLECMRKKHASLRYPLETTQLLVGPVRAPGGLLAGTTRAGPPITEPGEDSLFAHTRVLPRHGVLRPVKPVCEDGVFPSVVLGPLPQNRVASLFNTCTLSPNPPSATARPRSSLSGAEAWKPAFCKTFPHASVHSTIEGLRTVTLHGVQMPLHWAHTTHYS